MVSVLVESQALGLPGCRAKSPINSDAQLRDPAIFEENGRIYLFYAVAGESGIAIAELVDD
jgi:hypothetical protein